MDILCPALKHLDRIRRGHRSSIGSLGTSYQNLLMAWSSNFQPTIAAVQITVS